MRFHRGRQQTKKNNPPVYATIRSTEMFMPGSYDRRGKYTVDINYDGKPRSLLKDHRPGHESEYHSEDNPPFDPTGRAAFFDEEDTAADASWYAYRNDKEWQTRAEDAFGNGVTKDDPRYDDIADEDE